MNHWYGKLFCFIVSVGGASGNTLINHKWHYEKEIRVPVEYQSYEPFVRERLESVHKVYDCLPADQLIWYDPYDLLSWWRFDLMAKYIYACAYKKGVAHVWAQELYIAHLQVWGGLVEWDGSRVGASEYIAAFNKLLDDFVHDDFDPSIFAIRIDYRQYPCEGAHRIIAALVNNKKVACYYDNRPIRNRAAQATATFFKTYTRYVSGGLDQMYIDAMMRAYIQVRQNISLCIVCSTDSEPLSELLSILRSNAIVVDVKTLAVDPSIMDTLCQYCRSLGISFYNTCPQGEQLYVHIYVCESFGLRTLEELRGVVSACLADTYYWCYSMPPVCTELMYLLFHQPSVMMAHHMESAMHNHPTVRSLIAEFIVWREASGISIEDVALCCCMVQGLKGDNNSPTALRIRCASSGINNDIRTTLPSSIVICQCDLMSHDAIMYAMYHEIFHIYFWGCKWLVQ